MSRMPASGGMTKSVVASASAITVVGADTETLDCECGEAPVSALTMW